MFFFFRARPKKGIARHIDASSVVWTLIDNCKLANQFARLAAIVVKFSVPTVYFAVTISNVLPLSQINGSDNKKYISVLWFTLASLASPSASPPSHIKSWLRACYTSSRFSEVRHFGLNKLTREKMNKLQKRRENFVVRERTSSSLLNRKCKFLQDDDDTGLWCEPTASSYESRRFISSLLTHDWRSIVPVCKHAQGWQWKEYYSTIVALVFILNSLQHNKPTKGNATKIHSLRLESQLIDIDRDKVRLSCYLWTL